MNNNDIINKLNSELSSKIIKISEFNQQITIDIDKKNIFDVVKTLKNNLNFSYLTDITAIDYLKHSEYKKEKYYERFAVIYILYNFENKITLRLRSFISEDNLHIESIIKVFRSANWLEREVYDMFGITFDGHPKLERLLMPDYFEDYPLRKDYPLKGKGERTQFPKYKIEE